MRKLIRPTIAFAALSVLVLACEKGDDTGDAMIPETNQQPTTMVADDTNGVSAGWLMQGSGLSV